MKKTVQKLPEEEKFCVLCHDEMTIRSDIVYDKRSDNIIGFVNPQSWNFEEKVFANITR